MNSTGQQSESMVPLRTGPGHQRMPLAALPLAAALVFLPSWQVQAQTGSGPTAEHAAPAAESGADIRFERTDHDFGRIKSGEAVDLEFGFANPGSAPLKIREVRLSCGCTTLGTWTREVAPGQRGIIPVRFDSGQLSGPLQKTVTVVSNAASRPVVVLNILGTVWKDIDVLPNSACFTPHVDSDQMATKVISITNNLPEPLELATPQCAHPAIKAELAALEPGRRYELRISVMPPFGSGTFQAPVTIKTSSNSQPELRVTTIVLVQLPITPMPGVIALKPAPLAAPHRAAVVLRNIDDSAVVIDHPAVSVPGVAAAIQELEPGRVFQVTASFPAGFAVPAGTAAELTVRTSHPKYPVIRVPIQHEPGGDGFVALPSAHRPGAEVPRPPAAIAPQARVTVSREVELLPRVLCFAHQPGAIPPQRARIVNHGGKPLRLEAPVCDNPQFVVELRTIRDGWEYEVLVTAQPPAEARSARGVITLKTSSATVPTLTMTALLLEPPGR